MILTIILNKAKVYPKNILNKIHIKMSVLMINNNHVTRFKKIHLEMMRVLMTKVNLVAQNRIFLSEDILTNKSIK